MIDVPLLRSGQPYTSKEMLDLRDYATGESVARLSIANPGLISRDLLHDAWTPLQDLRVEDILGMLRAAAHCFMTAPLPVGGRVQSPENFVVMQCATTGLPHSLCRQNMAKIESAMLDMATILDGLTGGIDLDVLDTGYGLRDGHTVSYAPKARRFGAVLPANSPGVHALWLPAFALKMPLALKPGQREPWTPLRIIESLRAAGFPEVAFGFYPSGHDGAGVILRKCGAAMMFGSGESVRPWLGDPRIEIHGPGYSKVMLGLDKADAWRDYLDLIVTSVASNGGRSCINASSVRTPAHGRELAEALAKRLAEIRPRSRDDASALLAAFPDPATARSIDAAIERGLAQGGAEDISARFRGPQRLVEFEGGTYLLPTVIYCNDLENPLANQEYLFPFVSVLDVPAAELTNTLGPSLVVTALTDDPRIERDLLGRHEIGRLNLGPVPTSVLQWDQPHEGNVFTRLYQQRAFQRVRFATTYSSRSA
ncbi:MAG: aldehyde dehydrogenase family protein [Thermoguttaceae bacterium]|jgi:acyl-CoA reductase-like NAD-dependent aldehyde dehydrogenase